MKPQKHILKWLSGRELSEDGNISFKRSNQVTRNLIQRLGLKHELEGHKGCVNCLSWNEDGNLLASGSDDIHLILWDALRHRKMKTIKTRHNGNIFSVKFMPQCNDSILISGAGDGQIIVHDISYKEPLHIFTCHLGRVKRLATSPDQQNVFWSASEDGFIMQIDLRDPDSCKGERPKCVLIDLSQHAGAHIEAKCLAVNQRLTYQLAVGANDPYVRLYDRRVMSCKQRDVGSDAFTRIRDHSSTHLYFSIGNIVYNSIDTVKYYIAGHLPQKLQDYKRKHRTLASTYVTFSPDGQELLVNLGGEQIYLFDINRHRSPINIKSVIEKGLVIKETIGQSTLNGTNGFHEQHFKCLANNHLNKTTTELPLKIVHLKEEANRCFESKRYSLSISIYNSAIQMHSQSPILYSNRAAVYLKRNWDGDAYAAMRDCFAAIELDPSYVKAYYRLAKCLLELCLFEELRQYLELFQLRFPEQYNKGLIKTLEKDLKEAVKNKKEKDSSNNNGNSQQSWWNLADSPHNGSTADILSKEEHCWRSDASDYEARFCGHCNTTTDIKESNYFGSNGQFIVAGSDDGSFFIWDRESTNIVRVLKGDDSIVNCLEPHPTTCLLASSGIDHVVRLWSPRPDDGSVNEREVPNLEDAASANQQRMNTDPLELMLLNMGYRITSGGPSSQSPDIDLNNHMPCHTS